MLGRRRGELDSAGSEAAPVGCAARENVMPDAIRAMKPIAAAALLMSAVVLGGCGGVGGIDGVELQGGIFDALGVSGSSQKKGAEPKVAARPGLVLPPVEDRLPDPSQAQALAPGEAWPNDPDERAVVASAELDRRQTEFCERAKLERVARPDQTHPVGPKGPCQQTLFGNIGGMFGGGTPK